MSTYHYTECGLDNIYLVNGFDITKNSSGEEEIYIHDLNGLHQAIGLSLIYKSGLLAHDEIKFIRHTMDLSQTELARLLGVDYQSVLGWEKNKRAITKTVDHLLKTIFSLYLEKNNATYELINKIANYSAEKISAKTTAMLMKMQNKEWHCENKAA